MLESAKTEVETVTSGAVMACRVESKNGKVHNGGAMDGRNAGWAVIDCTGRALAPGAWWDAGNAPVTCQSCAKKMPMVEITA